MSLKDVLLVKAYVHIREKNVPRPDLEGLIAQSSEASYFYAAKVLRGRFERGEPSISESPRWAVKYARFVTRKRFIMAESKISKDSSCGYEYFRHVMKGRRLPEEMHRSMLLLSFENPDDPHIKKYFSEVPPD